MKQVKPHLFIHASLQLIDKLLCYLSTVNILRQFMITLSRSYQKFVFFWQCFW